MNIMFVLDVFDILIGILQMATAMSTTLVIPLLNWHSSGALFYLAKSEIPLSLWIDYALNMNAHFFDKRRNTMNTIRKLFTKFYLKIVSSARQCSFHCNYSDNYYGDQLCVPVTSERNFCNQ